MTKFTVGFVNVYAGELDIQSIEAKDWREAALKHSKTLLLRDAARISAMRSITKVHS